MAAFTAQVLIDRAKAAADMHDDFVTPTQWYRWMTVEVADLDVFIARSGYVYNEVAEVITANGNAVYTVPNVLAIIGVYHVDENTGKYTRLRAADPFTRQMQAPPATVTGTARYFHTSGSSEEAVFVSFYPRPTSGTYYVWYIPAPALIDGPTDQVVYPLSWEELIVLRLARRARMKEETDTSAIDQEIMHRQKKIEEAIWSRLLANSPAVRNVDRVERDSPGTWPAPSEWVFV